MVDPSGATAETSPPEDSTAPERHGLERLLAIAPFILLAVAAAYFAVLVSRQGIYWDEAYQRAHGQAILDWYASGFTDTRVFEQSNLFLYGGIVEMTLEWIVGALPGDPYLLRHAIVAGLALATLWATYRLGALVGGRPVGVLAMLLLLVSPRFIGHGSFNSKDVPTAAFYVWTVLLFVRDLRRPPGTSVLRVVPAGVALGLLLGTRFGAAVVLPAVLAGYLARWWGEEHGWRTLVQLVGRFAFAFICAWGVMLIGWPWALQRPLLHPVASLFASARFPWPSWDLFRGSFANSLDLPVSYVPTWFAITLPEIVLLGLAAAAGFVAYRLIVEGRRWSPGAWVVALALLIPPTYVIVRNVALYDGIRHLLFVQPLLVLAAAWGLVRLGRRLQAGGARPRAGGVAAVVLGVGVLLPAFEMVRLTPYEHVYFNRISGGLSAAAGRFELDYWGLSYREGVERLIELGAPRGSRLASCSYPESTGPFAAEHFDYVGSVSFGLGAAPEYLLLTTPHDCRSGPPDRSDPIHSVEKEPLVVRQGVPLLYLIDEVTPELLGSDG